MENDNLLYGYEDYDMVVPSSTVSTPGVGRRTKVVNRGGYFYYGDLADRLEIKKKKPEKSRGQKIVDYVMQYYDVRENEKRIIPISEICKYLRENGSINNREYGAIIFFGKNIAETIKDKEQILPELVKFLDKKFNSTEKVKVI